uniref:DYW domain-containing protein n=1 Tax=Kalanchoe fedtschenkoi TaxID=63787 RepID=A0A7N0T706_KALFE
MQPHHIINQATHKIPMTPNSLAFLVESAVAANSLLRGRAAHALTIKTLISPFPSFISNFLVHMYSKLDSLTSAYRLLSLTPPQNRNVVTWTSLISGAVQNGHFALALFHFSQMRRDSVHPNDFTFPCAFKASASLASVSGGKQLHGLALKVGEVRDVFVGCSVFDMYCKTGFREDALKMFDDMPHRNVATWNAYLSNAVLAGHQATALAGFIQFLREGYDPNSITFCAFLNACSDMLWIQPGRQLHSIVIKSGCENEIPVCNGLIDFYGKCKDITSSELIFSGMDDRNDVSWCSMVAAYVQNEKEEMACQVFLQARAVGIQPSDYLISIAANACAGLTGLELGRSVHGLAVKACVEENLFVGSAFVDMYGKCGSIEESEKAFRELPQKNLITWNAMIGGYAHQGLAKMALSLFSEMTVSVQKVAPNYVTLVCVLSACSRGGMVKVGMDIFNSMKRSFGIEPGVEHYACVVDMLGRAGLVEQAYDFIRKMSICPSISVWGALLGSCRVYGKPELGKVAAEKLFQLDPKDSGNHVLLSNMLAAAGRWEEADVVRKEMKDVGIKKGVGCSWITIKNEVHVFQAKDNKHKRNSQIQAMLDELRRKMKAAGYVADTKFALYDLEEEEKVSEVWFHSEKIALAFGLIVVPPGIPIRITKNLRICGDCHSAIKFISGILGREVIVRDNNRFHCFKDYKCSCNDYW